jgi:hypothetical protein
VQKMNVFSRLGFKACSAGVFLGNGRGH